MSEGAIVFEYTNAVCIDAAAAEALVVGGVKEKLELVVRKAAHGTIATGTSVAPPVLELVEHVTAFGAPAHGSKEHGHIITYSQRRVIRELKG